MRDKRVFYLPLCAMYDANGELDTINFLEVTLDCTLYGWHSDEDYNEWLSKGKVVLLSAVTKLEVHAIGEHRIVTLKRGKIKSGSLEAALCRRVFGSSTAFGGEFSRHVREFANLDNIVYYNSMGEPLAQSGTGIYLLNLDTGLGRYDTDIGTILGKTYYIDAKGAIMNLSACPLPWIQFMFSRLVANDRFVPQIAYGLRELPGVKSGGTLKAIPTQIREAHIISASQQAAQALMCGNAKATTWFAPRYNGEGAPNDILTYKLTDATYIPTNAEQVDLVNVSAPLVVPPSVMSLKLSGRVSAPIQFQKEMGYFAADIAQLRIPITTLPSIGGNTRTEALKPVFEYTLRDITPEAFTDTLVIPPFNAANSELKLDFSAQPCNKLVVPIAHEGALKMNLTKEQFQLCSMGEHIKSRTGRKSVASTYRFNITENTETVAVDVSRNKATLVGFSGSSAKCIDIGVRLGKCGIYCDALTKAKTTLYKTEGDLLLHLHTYRVPIQSEMYINGVFDNLIIELEGTGVVLNRESVPKRYGKRHIYLDADVNDIAFDWYVLPWVVLHVKKGVIARMVQRYAEVERKVSPMYNAQKRVFPAFDNTHYYDLFPHQTMRTLQDAIRTGTLIEDL